jgi:hypothetical protein
LLTVVCGAKLFDDLRSFDNVKYPDFKAACWARELLQDDGEWQLCLCETCQIQSGTSLQYLFASMLLFCQISNPETLWDDYKDNVCEDLVVCISNPTTQRIHDYGLHLINNILMESGYTLQHFPNMPIP